MSYNMIDVNLYEKVDSSVEQHYYREFANYQKYRIKINSDIKDNFSLDVQLIIEENEANDPKYAEVTVHKSCKINYKKLYNSDPFDKLFKSLDLVLNPYYIVESDGKEIFLTAKVKGKTPSMQTPCISIASNDIDIEIIDEEKGRDTSICVHKTKEIHLPITTFGDKYKVPKIDDIIYLVDRVENDRDRTFVRKITNVKQNAPCTCDVLTLNLPIDRLHNEGRVNGIGLQKPPAISNNYTASFNKTEIWRRKDNYKEILEKQKNVTGTCVIPIGNFMNMKPIVDEIVKSIDKSKFQYYGLKFHWTDYKDLLEPFYQIFGDYLVDHLFFLTSSQNRPDYLIHIDYDDDNVNMPVTGSFTWPAANCTHDTITVWYDCFKDNKKIHTYGEQDVVINDTSLVLKEKDRYSFDSDKFNSVILKHNEWHTVYNESNLNQDRMLLQWRFKPTFTWEQIKKIVENNNV